MYSCTTLPQDARNIFTLFNIQSKPSSYSWERGARPINNILGAELHALIFLDSAACNQKLKRRTTAEATPCLVLPYSVVRDKCQQLT